MPTPYIQKKKPGPPTKPKPSKEKQSKEPVQVFCRLRPLKNLTDLVVVRKVPNSAELLELLPHGPNISKQVFKFKKVFDENCNQKEVFENVAFPLVKDLINGQNGLIFTYGVTSSGKTHTITGTPTNCGILPRTLDAIFNTLDKNDLQSLKYVFKPDSQNGFEIISTPDALLQIQKEFSNMTPLKSSNGSKTPGSVRKNPMLEWEDRKKEDIFVKEINCDNNYAVFISYVEIYNNYIYDLLDESFETIRSNGIKQPRSKNLREDPKKKVYVNGVTEVEVKNPNEAFELFIKGIRRRRIGTTSLNSESSRSHSVFTIRLVQAPLDLNGTEMLDNKNYIHVSQLSIVDLAGCERTTRTQATGNRLKEASNINNSLMSLRNCFDILRDNQKFNSNKVVPYRDNKLTHLFKSYFEGDGKVEMVICINPGLEDYEETLHVAKFAEVSQEIVTAKSLVCRYPFRQRPFDNEINLAPISTIGPPFPNRFLEDPEDDRILPEWIECLEKRNINLENNILLNKENQMNVRHCIAELERDHMLIKQQMSVVQMDLDARESQLKEYENKFVLMERLQESLKKRINELEEENSGLHNRISVKELVSNKLQVELTELRSTISSKINDEKERLKKWCFMMLKEKEVELERQKCINQDKINLVKQILTTDEKELFMNFPMSPTRQQNPTSDGVFKSKTPDSKSKTCPKEETQTERRNGEAVINYAPPVVNHRKSVMTDNEKWIDHRPPGTIDMGTLMQPHIKNKKSVSNLKSTDILNTTASKYALTCHDASDGGTVEMHVFKGEVIPSVTGGAQVIFKDVETLKQKSPQRKRAVQTPTTTTGPSLPFSAATSNVQHCHVTDSRSHTPSTSVGFRSGSSSTPSSSHTTTSSSTPSSELHHFLSKYAKISR